MRVPLTWLREYVDPGLAARELGERLTMTGTKVESLHRHGVGDTVAFVVGRVLSAVQHPDADRLRVCLVDVGEAEPSQIVCGAPNVVAGQVVAVARPGAVMPDGSTLGTAKLRGVQSAGMILAEDELGIGADHAGIMELDAALVPGTALEAVLPIATEVLQLEITPNRPDCLGVYGVAREVHAATGAPLAAPPWAADRHPPGDDIDGVEIRVECPDLCPRFTARAFEDVVVGPSPAWLKGRLSAAGQRPISNVVDITNYVMLLTGQPLHAFDLDRVAGGRLLVRRATDGERVETLDGQVRELDSDVVVIEDDEGPTSIAGVMGGARSEVEAGTSRVLMEVAAWHGPNINRTSGKLGLRSEASARFEKNLSPRQTMDAQALASALMVDVCGARPVGGTIDVGGPGRDPAPIGLRAERAAELIGVPIAPERQITILSSLGCDVQRDERGLRVTPPYWRLDLTREADLVEEIARLDDVDALPATLHAPFTAGTLSAEQRARRRAEDTLVGRGLFEIAGWSFTEPGLLDRLRMGPQDPARRAVVVENPMSERESILRTTLLGSLLDAAAHNIARRMPDLGLFESGGSYLATDEALPYETHVLAALLTGRPGSEGWRGGSRQPVDFFMVKGLLAAVLGALRVPWSVEVSSEFSFLHPGRAAWVLLDGKRVGYLGELHPLAARSWDMEQAVGVFEVDLGAICAAVPGASAFRALPAFPAVREDIAVVVAADVPAARVLGIVREAAGSVLAHVAVFDHYPMEGGRVSLGLHLEFRASDRTLTDAEVAPVRERIVSSLRRDAGGELRA